MSNALGYFGGHAVLNICCPSIYTGSGLGAFGHGGGAGHGAERLAA